MSTNSVLPVSVFKLVPHGPRPTRDATAIGARESRAGSSVTVFVSVARTSLLEHVLRIVLDGPMIFCSVFSLGHSGVGALPSALALTWQPTPRLEKNAHLAEAWS